MVHEINVIRQICPWYTAAGAATKGFSKINRASKVSPMTKRTSIYEWI